MSSSSEPLGMYFQHAPEIWRDYPDLVAGVAFADGIDAKADVGPQVAAFTASAGVRLETASEGELPEIRAWRRTFSQMGLKPTQYRCASESLLRRFRREGALPHVHPLVDLCNAVSLAFAIPIAVFDAAQITEGIQVRYAAGDEDYVSLAGEKQAPDAHEVVFVDGAGQVHARRWTNRQAGSSAVREQTDAVLLVAEAMHDSAAADVGRLIATLVDQLAAVWGAGATAAILTAAAPRFEFGASTAP